MSHFAARQWGPCHCVDNIWVIYSDVSQVHFVVELLLLHISYVCDVLFVMESVSRWNTVQMSYALSWPNSVFGSPVLGHVLLCMFGGCQNLHLCFLSCYVPISWHQCSE